MQTRQKILIDTDIGDNMDDAFAILAAMALNFEIVGITTVFRDTVKRAAMAKRLLCAYGRGYESVPIYAGLSGSDASQNTAYQCSFADGLDLADYIPDNSNPEEAVDFIIDCCNRYGKELTVIALGPFCNMAKVIEKDPRALESANKVVIMGGAYFKQYADWNVMCDVPAADLMFRTLSNLECIGADVTHRLTGMEYLEKALSKPEISNNALRFVIALYKTWRSDYPDTPLVLHDALVVYYLYDPSICTMQKIRTVVVTDGPAKGLTLNIDSYGKDYLNSYYKNHDSISRVLAALDVDIAKFHQFVSRDISLCQRPNMDL